MSRIICIGNRLVEDDDFGPRVFDALVASDPPAGMDIIDGGLAGLNLLRHLDDGRPVVFVDNVAGFASGDGLVVLDGEEIARQSDGHYGHDAGLPFLVRILPRVVERPPRRIRLIGCEGRASGATVAAAAQLGLRLAGAPS